MKFRWGKEQIKGFYDPIKKAEVNEWTWWGLFVTAVIMVVLFISKMLGKI